MKMIEELKNTIESTPEPQNEQNNTPTEHIDKSPEETTETIENIKETPSETPKKKAGEQKQNQQSTQQSTTPSDPVAEDQTVETLKKIALTDGLKKAIQEAKKTKDPYIIDKLHDALVVELREKLKESGEIHEL